MKLNPEKIKQSLITALFAGMIVFVAILVISNYSDLLGILLLSLIFSIFVATISYLF